MGSEGPEDCILSMGFKDEPLSLWVSASLVVVCSKIGDE